MKFSIKTVLRILFVLSCASLERAKATNPIRRIDILHAAQQPPAIPGAQIHAQAQWAAGQVEEQLNQDTIKSLLFVGAFHQALLTIIPDLGLAHRIILGALGMKFSLFVYHTLGGDQIFGPPSITRRKAAACYAAGSLAGATASIGLYKAVSFAIGKLF